MINAAALAAQSRKNMVDSQIHTAGVVNPAVLSAFGTVPREKFVPPTLQGLAYVDEDLNLGGGRFLMDPSVLARMVDAAGIHPGDVVLNIGDDTGYASAILSMLATTVITVENQDGSLEAAKKTWADCSYCNVAVIGGDLTEGCPEHAPYNVIFMKGSVAEIPDIFLAQLSLNGRLVTVLKPAGAKIGTAVIVERIGDGRYSTRTLFDAATPYIRGFEPRPEFTF